MEVARRAVDAVSRAVDAACRAEDAISRAVGAARHAADAIGRAVGAARSAEEAIGRALEAARRAAGAYSGRTSAGRGGLAVRAAKQGGVGNIPRVAPGLGRRRLGQQHGGREECAPNQQRGVVLLQYALRDLMFRHDRPPSLGSRLKPRRARSVASRRWYNAGVEATMAVG